MSPENVKIETQISSYERIGSEEDLWKLVNTFYDDMDTLVESKTIRDLHAKDLRSAREKLFMFLSGWLGGPDRYIAAFGHPRLQARHLPFTIGDAERNQWLMCMRKALDEMPIDNAFKSGTWTSVRHERGRYEDCSVFTTYNEVELAESA